MAVKELLLLLCSVILGSAQTNVCTRAEAVATITAYYVQTSHTYYYSCGLFGWSRCDSVRYLASLNYRTDTTYITVMECCHGYHDPAGELDCQPFCEDCDSNHVCSAPFTCVCPTGWTGDDCSEPYCENCDSNHTCAAPFTCVCPEGWTGDDCSQGILMNVVMVPLDVSRCAQTQLVYTIAPAMKHNLALDSHSCIGLPENVTLTPNGSRYLLFKWHSPLLDPWDGDVTSYKVNCTSSFGFFHVALVSGGLTEYNVTNLMPFSPYACCVGAITTNGGSQYVCDTADTLQDKPGNAPQFTVNNHSAYAILVEWQPPTIPNGIITQYTIYIDYNNETSGVFYITQPDNSSFNLGGLRPHQLIGVRISANTIAGEGPVSPILSERTSQAVPSEVTDFNITAISPNELSLSWNLPDYPNGILIGYKIVSYNTFFNYNFSVFIPQTQTQYNLTKYIGPFVPYNVEVSAFTQAGEGIALKLIAFSQEGVPSEMLKLIVTERSEAMSFEIEWEALTLEQLRGFLVSYVLVYEELSTYQCPNLDILAKGISIGQEPSFRVSGLKPAEEYCVEITAQTSAGLGNATKFVIPLYTNILFQLHFTGVYNCPEWVHKDSLEKIDNFIQELSIEISKTCDCHIPVENFADERLICEPSRTDKVVFQSKLVLIGEKGTDEMLNIIDEWKKMKQHIVVQGVQLNVDYNCSVELKELGNGECVTLTMPTNTTTSTPDHEKTSSPTESNNNNTDSEKQSSDSQSINVSPIVLGISLVVLVIVIIAVAGAVCYKGYKRTINQRKKANDAIQMRSPGELNINETENPLYISPARATRGLPSYDELEEETKELYPE